MSIRNNEDTQGIMHNTIKSVHTQTAEQKESAK